MIQFLFNFYLKGSNNDDHMEIEPIINEEDDAERKKFYFEQLVNALITSRLIERLNTYLNNSDQAKREFIRAYLNDYLLIKCANPIKNAAHFELIKKRLINACQLKFKCGVNDWKMLIAIHICFEELSPEFELFSKFCHVQEDLIGNFSSHKQNYLIIKYFRLNFYKNKKVF